MYRLLSLLIVFVLQCQVAGVGSENVAGARKINSNHNLEHAYFAAGCFWHPQYIFSKVPGVVRTRVGYTGGHLHNPKYEDVCTDTTGHAETVLVAFDPTRTTYRKLLEVFWANHDPTTPNRQGPDVGTQYRSVVFYDNPQQKSEALKYKSELEAAHHFKSPIVTSVEPIRNFYEAEEYHQDYFVKHGKACF